MADLRTKMCGLELKNPVIVAACDFGEHERLAKRVIEQGIGGLVSKTIHKIPGPDRWPRPYFYSLRKFGKEFRDTWVCSEMFSSTPYEEWLEKDAPKIKKLCEKNDVRFIASISGIGVDLESWVSIAKDMVAVGADAIELDTGGPHATFGAEESAKDVGAPIALDPEKAYKVTKACVDAVSIPVLFKMTPQSVNTAQLSLAIERAGAGGISANNAFYGTWIDHETGTFYGGPYSGGLLVGRAWQPYSLAKVLEVTATAKLPVSGIGGIFAAEDAVRYMMAGCSTVQLCSSIYTRGVGVLKEVIDGLGAYMDRKGYKSVEEFIGLCLPQFSYIRDWPREEKMAHPSPIQPLFDNTKCKNCNTCEKLCPYGAITMSKENGPIVNGEYCNGCGWCVGHCPQDAVNMIKVDTGEIIWNGRGLPKKWAEKA